MESSTRRTRLTTGGRTRRRPWIIPAVVAAAFVFAVLSTPLAAHAHTELVSSSPAQGVEVPMQLDRIRLEFGEVLLPAGSDLVVHDPQGGEASVGAVDTRGNTVEAGVVLGMPGRHTLTYRVVGQDGHAITGELWFTVTDGRHETDVAVPQRDTATPVGAGGAQTSLQASSPQRSPRVWLLPGVGLVLALLLLHAAGGRRARVRARSEDAAR